MSSIMGSAAPVNTSGSKNDILTWENHLPDEDEFARLLENNPQKLVRVIHYHLSAKNPGVTEAPEKIARLFLSYIRPREGRGPDPNDTIKARLFDTLPPQERAAIIRVLRQKIKSAELADYLLNEYSPQQRGLKEVFSAVGKDKNQDQAVILEDKDRDGILSEADVDKGRDKFQEADLNQDGWLSYYELSQLRSDKSQKVLSLFKDDIMQRMESGIVTESDIAQLQEMAKTSKEARVFLAQVKAYLLVKHGKYRKALAAYHKIRANLDKRHKRLYQALLRYRNQLAFLEELAASWPQIVKNQNRIFPGMNKAEAEKLKSASASFYRMTGFVFSTADGFNEMQMRAMLRYLPPEAKGLKARLKGFLAKAKTQRAWQITMDGKPLTRKLTNADLKREVEILVPKMENAAYEYRLSVHKTGEPKDHAYHVSVEYAAHTDNPLFVKIRVPLWRVLENADPGKSFDLEVRRGEKKDKEKKEKGQLLHSFKLKRSGVDYAQTRVASLSASQYYKGLAQRIRQGNPLEVSYVLLSNNDHPEDRIAKGERDVNGRHKGRKSYYRWMSYAWRKFPELFRDLKLTDDQRDLLNERLSKAVNGKTMKRITDPKIRKAWSRLMAIQDSYFTETYGFIGRRGWKLKGVEQPKPRLVKRLISAKYKKVIGNARLILTYEKRVKLKDAPPFIQKAMEHAGKTEMVLRMRLSYYTDTTNGYKKAFEALKKDNYAAVMLQGHRLKHLSYRPALRKTMADFKGRKTGVAYYALHCHSSYDRDNVVAALNGKVYAPVVSNDEVFPSPEVMMAGFLDPLLRGEAVDPKNIGKIYEEVLGKKGKGKARVHQAASPYAYKNGDTDGDGLPDLVDPDPGKDNTFSFNERGLQIKTSKGKVLYRDFTPKDLKRIKAET